MREKFVKKRWVRFLKRTHRSAFARCASAFAKASADGMADEMARSRDGRRPLGIFGQSPSTRLRARGPQKHAFCDTKPFVMLTKWHLYGAERRSCVDCRKMTNGFVF